ncbi:MAG: HNH endonuclease signature motif containing protein [Vulcanimicrobiota bacterium]
MDRAEGAADHHPPENERERLDFALKNKAQAVERAVALTPTQHKRGEALKASLEARQAQPELELAEPAKPTPVLRPAPVPEVPKLIQVTLLMTAEQYATYEQAKGVIDARHGKRVNKEMARVTLTTADNRSKVRHQVIMHVHAETSQGHYDTDRGLLPAPVEEALKQTGVVVAGTQTQLPAGSRQAEQLPLFPSRARTAGGPGASGLCSRFRPLRAMLCSGGNLVSHHVRAWSETRRHRLEDLELLCPGCHSAEHDKDFAERPQWRAARDAAVSRRASSPAANAPDRSGADERCPLPNESRTTG